jgi:hypothetical protein
LKNNTVHGINKPWIEKTSTEDLKNSGSGKMPFAFMLFHDSNIPSFHVSGIKLVSLKAA